MFIHENDRNCNENLHGFAFWAANGFAPALFPAANPAWEGYTSLAKTPVRVCIPTAFDEPNAYIPSITQVEIDHCARMKPPRSVVWPGMDVAGARGWTARPPATDVDIADFDRLEHIRGASANIALRTGKIPGSDVAFGAIDIDLADATLVAAVRNAIEAQLGTLRPRGRENTARITLYCRLSEDAAALPKRVIQLPVPEGDAPQAVEILLMGRQSIVEGTTGKGRYVYPEGRPIAAELPIVDVKGLRALEEAITKVFTAAGHDMSGSAKGWSKSGGYEELGAERFIPPNGDEDLFQWFRDVPNTVGNFPKSDDVFPVVAAASGAATDRDAVKDATVEWLNTFDGTSEKGVREAESLWDSIHYTAVGYSYLCALRERFAKRDRGGIKEESAYINPEDVFGDAFGDDLAGEFDPDFGPGDDRAMTIELAKKEAREIAEAFRDSVSDKPWDEDRISALWFCSLILEQGLGCYIEPKAGAWAGYGELMDEVFGSYSWGWDMPDPSYATGIRTLPTFPIELFPPIFRDWCVAQARARSAPLDYVAAALLVIVAGILGVSIRATAKGNWEEPMILWLAVIGGPSIKKTPGIEPPVRLMRHVDKVEKERVAPLRKEWLEAKEIADITESIWKGSIKEAIKKGKAPPPRPPSATCPPEPIARRVEIQDHTPEVLMSILARQEQGLLIHLDELRALITGMDQYKSAGKGTHRQFMLNAYNGKKNTTDRKGASGSGGESLEAEINAISILGGIQPELVPEITEGEDDGLAARFLYVQPVRSDVYPLVDRIDSTAQEAAVLKLARIKMRGEAGKKVPNDLPLTPEALDVFEAYRLQNIKDVRAAPNKHFAAFLGKNEARALRIAGVLEAMAWACGSDEDEFAGAPAEIGPDRLREAIRLIEEYFVPHARDVFKAGELSADDAKAAVVVERIRDLGVTEFQPKALRRGKGMDQKVREAEDMTKACAVLQEDHVVRLKPRPKGRAGRWDWLEVNPVIHAAKAG